jgi:cytochrome c oxidase cbb3-type subunit 3
MTGRARILVACCALGALLPGCQREQRRFSEVAPASRPPGGVATTELRPGGGPPPASRDNPYERNAWAVGEGKQLYQKYNCVGCHANGGGGMGPPLMDDTWIYGSSSAQIHESIAQGRPNGMPAFGEKIPDAQIWKLAAYVRSMSGLLAKDVSPSRDDHMAFKPAEQTMPRQAPTSAAPPK